MPISQINRRLCFFSSKGGRRLKAGFLSPFSIIEGHLSFCRNTKLGERMAEKNNERG